MTPRKQSRFPVWLRYLGGSGLVALAALLITQVRSCQADTSRSLERKFLLRVEDANTSSGYVSKPLYDIQQASFQKDLDNIKRTQDETAKDVKEVLKRLK